MLKQILFNKKKVPVPVPIRTLSEALEWVGQTLLGAEATITKVALNGQELDFSGREAAQWLAMPLTPESKLAIQADSPLELAVQTGDVLRNLVAVLERTMKPTAVKFWQTLPKDRPAEVDSLDQDVHLIVDLTDHLVGLLEEQVGSQQLADLARAIADVKVTLAMAVADSDWKGAARILLNRLEPLLSQFSQELANLQKALFELLATSHVKISSSHS